MNMIWFNAFLGWQIKRLKNPCIKNGPIRPGSKNLLFFLDVTSKLFQHISELNNLCEEICKVEIDKLAKLQGLVGESWMFKICDKGNISESLLTKYWQDKSNIEMTKYWMWKNIDKENHSEFACVVPEKQGYNHSSLSLWYWNQ